MTKGSRLPHRVAFGEFLAFARARDSNRLSIGHSGGHYRVHRERTRTPANQYEGGAPGIPGAASDPLTIRDFDAVMEQIPGISASSPIVGLYDNVA
jgi:hypothetical protein